MSFFLVTSNISKEESAPAASDKTVNKVNPNEFDPLQDKEKKVEEIKKEQKNTDVPSNEPAFIQQQANVVKTTNPQMGEYYGNPPIYGLC